MSRLNIEGKFFRDPRYLCMSSKLGPATALGTAVLAWRLAEEYWVKGQLIPEKVWKFFEHHEVLAECGFATKEENGWYVSGTKTHSQYRIERSESGRTGGRISAQRARDSKGRLMSKQTPSKIKQTQPSSSSSSSISIEEGTPTKTLEGKRFLEPKEVEAYTSLIEKNSSALRSTDRGAVARLLKIFASYQEAKDWFSELFERNVEKYPDPKEFSRFIVSCMHNEVKKFNEL